MKPLPEGAPAQEPASRQPRHFPDGVFESNFITAFAAGGRPEPCGGKSADMAA